MRKIIRLNRLLAKLVTKVKKVKKGKTEPVVVEEKEETGNTSKKVYAFLDGKNVGVYDSITKCGTALGLSRLMVRKAIENDVTLENGWKLKLTKK